ncbi:hypothetical protein SKAU_G00180920 [Synaphobranchus kaupii]|uniref:Uncharacterized protein n=1 Tax=Synaphobranchus kaupii TaxID=118154 RepID=A0A9Q1FM55_SYNKA|nr:hypothetical protein SKAU_G00180920 [Synaphobranchus kaupii]
MGTSGGKEVRSEEYRDTARAFSVDRRGAFCDGVKTVPFGAPGRAPPPADHMTGEAKRYGGAATPARFFFFKSPPSAQLGPDTAACAAESGRELNGVAVERSSPLAREDLSVSRLSSHNKSPALSRGRGEGRVREKTNDLQAFEVLWQLRRAPRC